MFQNNPTAQRTTEMKRGLTAIVLATISLFYGGCGESDDNFTAAEASGGYIIMDTRSGDIPYPNDILFADSTDGTLNIPYDPADSDAPVKMALNTLDGFSTVAPITVSVSAEINVDTLSGHLHLYRVAATDSNATSPIPIVGAILSELVFGVDYIAVQSGSKIAILPLKPLDPDSNYMVIMTKGVTDIDGKNIAPDYLFSLLIENTPLFDEAGNPAVIVESDPELNKQTLQKLAGLQLLAQQMLAVAQKDAGVDPANVIAVWSFKTQTIGAVASAFTAENYSGAQLGLQSTGLTSKDILLAAGYDVGATMSGIADVYAGTLSNLRYYLGVPTAQNPTAPLEKAFEFNGGALPQIEANLTIPVLATVPNNCGAMPAEGWPVVIFQHGITQNRTNLLPISEAFAAVCYAAVAIDLPLHGIEDNTSALYMASMERTFDVDYVTQDDECNVVASEPDGKTDCSGTHYINLASLLTSRDNIRQSTADFIALKNSLSAAAVSADGLKFDPVKVAYTGHSLGAMAPYAFLANFQLESAVLANPGGGIAQLLNNSETFGPLIKAGLAAKGIEDGSAEYEAFMVATQTVIDDADPINYAQSVAANQRSLVFEVLADQVVPNSVATAPLSGTDPLLRVMGAVDLNTSAAPGIVAVGATTASRFTEGSHSSILDPSVSAAATVEMQTQTASFIASGGTAVQVDNPSIIAQ